MPASRRNAIALVAGAVVLIVASSASSAVATKLITGADIKDRSITGADIKPGSVPGNRLEPGSVRAEALHETAVRSGHVHFSGSPDSRRPRNDSGADLANGKSTLITTISNVKAGDYVYSVSGSIGLFPVSGGQTIGNCSVWVSGTPNGNGLYLPLPTGVTSDMYIPFTITRVIYVPTSGDDIQLYCDAYNSAAGSQEVGTVWADSIATPVSSVDFGN